MHQESDIPTSQEPLAWPAAAGALVAFAGLYVTGGRFWGLPAMGAALACSYLTQWRLPERGPQVWALRIAVYSIITISVGIPRKDVSLWYMKPEYTNLLGYLLAAELMLRGWRRYPAAQRRRAAGTALILGTLVMTAASNTYDRMHMQVLIPLYTLLLVLASPMLGPMMQPAARKPPVSRALAVLRLAVLAATLAGAFAAVWSINRYEYRLSSLAVQLLQSKYTQQKEVGWSASARLGAVNNPNAAMTRMLLMDAAPGEYHLRAMAFDVYDSAVWQPPLTGRTFAPVAEPAANSGAGGELLRFTRLSDTLEVLPAPLEAGAIVAGVPIECDDQGTLIDTGENPCRTYQVDMPARHLPRAMGLSESLRGPLSQRPDARQRERLLAVPPEIDSRVVELARRVAGDGTAAQRVELIKQYLLRTHAYSLQFDPHGEPLSDFILNNRAAHCQYFASAMVMMARAVAVPARFVNGFDAHESFGQGQIVVRQRDAHAWAECWIEGQGWVTVDATPSTGRPVQMFSPATEARYLWEKMLDLPRIFRDWLALAAWRLEAATGVVAVVAVGAAVAKRIRSRRRRPQPLYMPPGKELAEISRRFGRWMAGQKIACGRQHTWRESLLSWPQRGALPGPWLEFIDVYDQARFGQGQEAALGRARRLLNELEQARI